MNTTTYSICAGLHNREFYVIRNGDTVLPNPFPTFLAASEFVKELGA